MDYMTLDEWGELNPELIGKEFQPSELPVLKLNPIILTLYHKKYKTKCSLSVFLQSIQDSSEFLHNKIKKDLKREGVKSKAVGGGEVSDKLFEWISKESYIINDYFIKNEGVFKRPTIRLSDKTMTFEFNHWWFSPGLFVVDLGTPKYQFINWITVMPLDGGK